MYVHLTVTHTAALNTVTRLQGGQKPFIYHCLGGFKAGEQLPLHNKQHLRKHALILYSVKLSLSAAFPSYHVMQSSPLQFLPTMPGAHWAPRYPTMHQRRHVSHNAPSICYEAYRYSPDYWGLWFQSGHLLIRVRVHTVSISFINAPLCLINLYACRDEQIAPQKLIWRKTGHIIHHKLIPPL